MAATITVPVQGYAHDAAFFQPEELTSRDLFSCAYSDGTHAYSVQTIQAIHANGHGILWNHERGQLDLAGGAPAGTLAATQAIPPILAAGTPVNGTVAIFYSVDGSVPNTDAAMAPYAEAFAAIRAVHAGRFLIGFYGELALYKYLKARGLVDVKAWLSGSSSYPGWNPNDPDVGLIQTVGTDIPSTDRDLVTDLSNLGVWMTTPLATQQTLADLNQHVANIEAWMKDEYAWASTNKNNLAIVATQLQPGVDPQEPTVHDLLALIAANTGECIPTGGAGGTTAPTAQENATATVEAFASALGAAS